MSPYGLNRAARRDAARRGHDAPTPPQVPDLGNAMTQAPAAAPVPAFMLPTTMAEPRPRPQPRPPETRFPRPPRRVPFHIRS